MRKTAPVSVGQLWEEFVKERPSVARGLAGTRAAEAWPQIVGPVVASFTESVSVEKGIMYVRMSSAAARSEVFMRRRELKEAVNKAVGMKVVNELIVK